MARKLYVTVVNDREERHEEFFVAELTEQELDDMGDYGCERLARQHAALLGLEYVTYSI